MVSKIICPLQWLNIVVMSMPDLTRIRFSFWKNIMAYRHGHHGLQSPSLMLIVIFTVTGLLIMYTCLQSPIHALILTVLKDSQNTVTVQWSIIHCLILHASLDDDLVFVVWFCDLFWFFVLFFFPFSICLVIAWPCACLWHFCIVF